MKKNIIVMGLALGLPSTILGVFAILYHLVEEKFLTWNIALVILLLVVFNTFYLMIRYVNKRKN